jgi:hypothetical protein
VFGDLLDLAIEREAVSMPCTYWLGWLLRLLKELIIVIMKRVAGNLAIV